MQVFYGVWFCLVSYEQKTGKSDKVSKVLHLNPRHAIIFVLTIDHGKLLDLKALPNYF